MKSTTFLERRTFIRNAGAALSATVASTAAVTSEPTSAHDAKLSEAEIRQLHHTFVERLNGRLYDELRELYEVQPDAKRPYVAHFERPLPEGVLPPVHDYFVGHQQHLDTVVVAPDRHSATAWFHCLTRMEAELSSTLPLIEMARQQGQGVIQWWESGILESTCVRSASGCPESRHWRFSGFPPLRSGWRLRQVSFRSDGLWSPLQGSTGS